MINNNAWDAVERIENKLDREKIKEYIQHLQLMEDRAHDERDWLRKQVTNAIQSLKLDLHPEVNL